MVLYIYFFQYKPIYLGENKVSFTTLGPLYVIVL